MPDVPRVVLLVEDNADVRESLSAFLEHEGFHVHSAGSAEDAMGRLALTAVDALVTDHHLPGQPGRWLVGEAIARGLLSASRVLIITALEAALIDPPVGVRVLRKPIDLDELAGWMLAAVGPTSVENVELVLYTSPSAPPTQRAQQALAAAVELFETGTVRLSFRDVTAPEHAAAAAADRVAFVPTLIVRGRRPLRVQGSPGSASEIALLIERAGGRRKP